MKLEYDYNVICDRTGFKKRRSECVKEWDGKLVWKKVFVKRNPLDFAPVIPPTRPIADPRPEGVDKFYD